MTLGLQRTLPTNIFCLSIPFLMKEINTLQLHGYVSFYANQGAGPAVFLPRR